jgi:CTP:molybdopterin cytidylyltransferase MocA
MSDDRSGQPFCVLPAAGAASRFGRAKQVATLDGTPLLLITLREAAAAFGGRVLVVAGAHLDAVTHLLTGARTPFTINPDWPRGLGGSIAAGIRALPSGTPAAMVLNADQVRVTRDDLARVLAAWRAGPDRVVCSRYAGTCGPPAVFPARLFARLAALHDEPGARAVIDAEGERVVYVDVPNAAIDVDTEAELDALATNAKREPPG